MDSSVSDQIQPLHKHDWTIFIHIILIVKEFLRRFCVDTSFPAQNSYFGFNLNGIPQGHTPEATGLITHVLCPAVLTHSQENVYL